MTGRDRLVVIVVATLAVLGVGWLLVVSPERQKASKLQTQVAQASSQLTAAEGKLAEGRSAQSRYAAAYAALVSLGKAVPPGREVPSLIYQLAKASNEKHVDFSAIVSGTGSAAATSSASTTSPTTAATAAVSGFTQMPFTFTFTGTFSELYNMFQQLNRFTVRTATGGIDVSGRLLTIQSAQLAPVAESSTTNAPTHGPRQLTGTITATAYVLPAAQGVTGAAIPASAPGAPAPSNSSASTGGRGSGSPTAPAIARVTP